MDEADNGKIKQEIADQSPQVKHSRSKSQSIVAMSNNAVSAETELLRHFERSLNRHYHAKSKSLPRPMRERNLPSSFFIENNTISQSATGSSTSLSEVKKKPSSRVRTKSKEQLRKSNSLSRSYNKKLLDTVGLNVKSEPVSPGSLKVSSPGSCYSSASSPQSQTSHQPPQISIHQQPIIGHHRSRSCPVQPSMPKIPSRKKKLNATLEAEQHKQQQGTPATFDVDVNRIRLPPHWSIGNQNGILYYVDHQNKTTTYEDPRIQIREKLKYDHQMLCMNEMMELPAGYERRIKIDTHEIFYVNHNTRTTSWIHPKVEQLLIPEEELNANIQFPPTQMEVAESPPQQQPFPNFDYYGSPPPPPLLPAPPSLPALPAAAAQQQPQTPSQNGPSMMMSRLEHEMREQQQNQQFHPRPQFPVSPLHSSTDADYHSYVQKTVGWRQAHHMQQATSSSLPTRFNPLAANHRGANRSSPISNMPFQPQREMIGHRRQRSLDQLRMDQLRIGTGAESCNQSPNSQQQQQVKLPFTDEDLDLIREIDVQPLDTEMSDDLINQLINDHTSFTT